MEMSEMLGWVQAFFEQLGLWSTITTALTIAVVLATAGVVIRFVNGGR